jgi:cytoskeletal protein CcmA (bactofilin family)
MFNAAMQLRFRDSAISIGSAADGDLDINADDEIELNSTLIDINGNLDVSGTGVIAGALTSAAFTASGIIKTDDTTAATSTTDGSLQTDGGLSVTLDAVIGDDLFMLSDAAVVTFGAGKDVTLTHVHDTGLLLNAAMVMQFRDSAINIGSPADGDLDINADDEIELNSTLIDINGAVDISGATTVGGILKTDDTTAATNTTDGSLQTDGGLSVAADAVIGDDLFMLSDAAVVTFGADKDVTLTHVHNTGILLNSTNVIQFNDASQNIGAPSATVLDINATDEIELNATLVDINANVEISGNLTVAGTTTQVDTVTMNAANAVVFEGATADAHETTLTIVDPTGDRTINLPNVSGTIPVLAAASTTQITSTPAELNILDGATVVVGEINALDIGSTAVGTAVASKAVILDSSKDYTGIRNLTISGEIDAATGDYSGAVDIAGATTTAAITASGIIKTDDTTAATSTTDGSLQTDGGLSVTLDAVIGDDLFMLSDAAVVTFGANKDVTLTHVHNTGLLLNAAMVMQFRDSAINIGSPADGDLDINADDEIELNSTLIDVNGNLDVSGTGVIAGAVTTAALTASGIIKTDDTTAATSTTDGSLQTDGGLSVTLDAVIGDDLFMLSDAAVVTFGANKDVTLTHVHNTGLLLNAAMVVQFRDSAINIGSPADGDLDINADDEIELNSTLIDINGNLDVSGTGVIAGAVTTAALTASGIIKTDDTTAATSTTDGSLQTDGGLSVAADAVIGDDLFMLSDAAVVTFGADKDVTLTHVADTGLLLNAAMVVQFRDSAINIGSPADGDLDINADDEIELNSTLIDVNGNLDVSGTIVGAGAITGGGLMTTGGNIVIPNAGNIGSAGDTDSIAIASNGVVTFSQAPVFPDGSIAVADLDIDGATDIGAAIVDADLFIVDDGAGGTNRKTTAARLKTYIDAASAPVQLLIKDVDDAVIAIRVGLASGGTDVEIQNSAGTALKSMTGAFTSADAALAA